MATTTSQALQASLAPEPACPKEIVPSLLRTFQSHIENMRNLVLCKICIKPLYEPYILTCGHTYCYSCLSSWFGGFLKRSARKNCPDCRASVTVQPSPNYILRDLVHMFISRIELLPEDESTAEHDEAKLTEAQLIETDRSRTIDGASALFNGAFCLARTQPHRTIRDDEDGVLRCPMCTWEMEDGECLHCGYMSQDADFSGDDYYGDTTMGTGGILSTPSSPVDADIDADDRDYPWSVGEIRQIETSRRPARGRRTTDRDGAALRGLLGRRRDDWQFRNLPADAGGPRSTMGRPHVWPHPGGEEDGMETDVEPPELDLTETETETQTETETETEDDEMTSTAGDNDGRRHTSYLRQAMQSAYPDTDMGSETDSTTTTGTGERGGNVETATIDDSSSSDPTDSEDDSDTPEATTAGQSRVNRPTRIVIDSEDDSSTEDSSSEEEEADGAHGSGARSRLRGSRGKGEEGEEGEEELEAEEGE